MKRRIRIPRFKSDREAADFWATHDSMPYVKDLKPADLSASPALRRRVKAKSAARKKH
ncbi:MAG TPA: CopG family antitoxin [Methylomirabilota bacterium]|nr:CopG family antitoxin [Methylomirabilota bacterium]